VAKRSGEQSSALIVGTRPPGSNGRLAGVEMLIVANPDPDSKLPYLLRLPLVRE